MDYLVTNITPLPSMVLSGLLKNDVERTDVHCSCKDLDVAKEPINASEDCESLLVRCYGVVAEVSIKAFDMLKKLSVGARLAASGPSDESMEE